MALFPCDESQHVYDGRQQTIYPAVVLGIGAYRRKLRLCPIHFKAKVQDLETLAVPAQLDLDRKPEWLCFCCRKTVSDARGSFYATVYATNAERADYWAPVHESCVPEALRLWALEPEST